MKKINDKKSINEIRSSLNEYVLEYIIYKDIFV
jgi:hypothetical protein